MGESPKVPLILVGVRLRFDFVRMACNQFCRDRTALKSCLPAALKKRAALMKHKPSGGDGIVSCSGTSCAPQPRSPAHTDRTSVSMLYSCRASASLPPLTLPQSLRRKEPNTEARAVALHASGFTQVRVRPRRDGEHPHAQRSA